MIVFRKSIFETTSSSTHSFSIDKHSEKFQRLDKIFDTILYGDVRKDIYGIEDIDCAEDLLELISLLNEAQQILLEGTVKWD